MESTTEEAGADIDEEVHVLPDYVRANQTTVQPPQRDTGVASTTEEAPPDFEEAVDVLAAGFGANQTSVQPPQRGKVLKRGKRLQKKKGKAKVWKPRKKRNPLPRPFCVKIKVFLTVIQIIKEVTILTMILKEVTILMTMTD